MFLTVQTNLTPFNNSNDHAILIKFQALKKLHRDN